MIRHGWARRTAFPPNAPREEAAPRPRAAVGARVFPGGRACLRGTGGPWGREPYGTIFRSLFGEPLPGLVTLPEVAPFTRAEATWAGVAEVWFAR